MAELLIYSKEVNSKKIDPSKEFEQGDIIEAVSDQHISYSWFDMLVRGTHGRNIPFIPKLYKKYYRRLIIHYDGSITEDPEPVENFRKALAQSNILRSVDQPVKKITFPITTENISDMIKYFSFMNEFQEFSDRRIYECWNWGKEELRNFLPVYIPDSEFNRDDRIIQGLKDPIIKKNAIVKKRKYYIDYISKSSDLQLNYTAKQIFQSDVAPEKMKKYLLFLFNKGYINTDTTLLNIVHDRRIPFYNRFITKLSKAIIKEKSS